MAHPRPPVDPNQSNASQPAPQSQPSAMTEWANRLVLGIARYWLWLVNGALAVYLLLPFVAPFLMDIGLTRPASAIYFAYSFACHQLPDHSYFLFGGEPLYSLQAMEARGMPEGLGLFEQRRFVGNELLGYKVGICQRDVAIYGSMLLSGVIFGLVWRRLPTLNWRYYLLFLIPIALDGGTQLVGLRESNWWLRTVTGALFGIGSIWLVYPLVQDAMLDVIETQEQRFVDRR